MSTNSESQLQLLRESHNRNTALHVSNAALFHFGFLFIQPAFVIVAYLKHFTSHGMVLNLPLFLMQFALGVSPFLASLIRLRTPRRKGAFVFASVVQRIMLIPMIVIAARTPAGSSSAVWLFLLAYAAYNAAWGFSYYYWQELVGRTLDPDRRTQALGLRDAGSKVIDLVAGGVAVYVLRVLPFPQSFAVCFALALGAMVFSVMLVLPMREIEVSRADARGPVTATTGRRALGGERLRSILRLPAENRDFAWFIVFVMVSQTMLFVGGLYTSVLIDRFGATHGGDSLSGVAKLVTSISAVLAALVMGRVTDRYGRFAGFLPTVLASITAPIVAMFAGGSLFLQMSVFVLRGLGMTRWYLEISTTLSFAPPEDHHRYIAFVGIAKLVPVVIYTNAGGAIAEYISPNATFAAAALLSLTALAVLVFALRPRWASDENQRG